MEVVPGSGSAQARSSGSNCSTLGTNRLSVDTNGHAALSAVGGDDEGDVAVPIRPFSMTGSTVSCNELAPLRQLSRSEESAAMCSGGGRGSAGCAKASGRASERSQQGSGPRTRSVKGIVGSIVHERNTLFGRLKRSSRSTCSFVSEISCGDDAAKANGEELEWAGRHFKGWTAGAELRKQTTSWASVGRRTAGLSQHSHAATGVTITGGGEPDAARSVLRSRSLCCGTLDGSVRVLVCRPEFNYFLGLMIVANALAIGVQCDYMARNVFADNPQVFTMLERMFCGVFTLELLLRLYSFRCAFFTMPGWKWNVFDVVVVLLQLIELFTMDIYQSNLNFSAMRMLRVLRLIRIIRLVRVMRLISELRTIVVSIAGSMRSLLWTVVLLLLMIYIVAVYLTQLVSDYRRDHSKAGTDVEERLAAYYGSLSLSVLSLYQSMSGGIDWNDAASPLIEHISPLLGVVYALYIAFAVLAIMNVVTGVFVESSLQTAKNDKDLYMVHHVRKLFGEADMDGSGTLSWEEFEGKLIDDQMLQLFKSIDIDIREAKALFQLLDLDEAGSISSEEFLNGCLRLRGPAKSIDLVTVMYEHRRHSRRLERNIMRMDKYLRGVMEAFRNPLGPALLQ